MIVLGESKEDSQFVTNKIILKKHFKILVMVKGTNQHSASSLSIIIDN